MTRKRYAERREMFINKEKARRYEEEVLRDYSDDEEYVHNDLEPRLFRKRSEVAFLRLQLHEQEYELQKLEDEYEEYKREDQKHFEECEVCYYRSSFESTLTDAQIEKLLPVINKYVFSDPQTVKSVREWMDGKNQQAVKVKDIAELCNLLNLLRDNGYICGNAQTVADENKTFVGGKGNHITQKNLTASLYKKRKKDEHGRYDINQIINEDILSVIKELAGVKG